MYLLRLAIVLDNASVKIAVSSLLSDDTTGSVRFQFARSCRRLVADVRDLEILCETVKIQIAPIVKNSADSSADNEIDEITVSINSTCGAWISSVQLVPGIGA